MSATVYARVSTSKQDEESQLESVKARRWRWDTVLRDRVSGAVKWQERELGTWMQTAQKGDVLIVSELSRIARSVTGVMSFLAEAVEKGVKVMDAKTGQIIDDSLPSKVLCTVFALAAEIERDLVRSRTRAAVARRKAEGKPIGRITGATNKTLKYQAQWENAKKLLDSRASASWVARTMRISRQTLYNLAEANNYDMKERCTIETKGRG